MAGDALRSSQRYHALDETAVMGVHVDMNFFPGIAPSANVGQCYRLATSVIPEQTCH